MKWRDEAACLGQAADLFEVPDLDVISEESRQAIRRRMLQGKEICDTICPVRSECYMHASPSDLMHTVRGGTLPSGYSNEHAPEGRAQRRVMPATKLSKDSVLQSWINELPVVFGWDHCPKGDPITDETIAASDLSVHAKERSGIDPNGKCRRCKDRASKRRAKEMKRQRDRAILKLSAVEHPDGPLEGGLRRSPGTT